MKMSIGLGMLAKRGLACALLVALLTSAFPPVGDTAPPGPSGAELSRPALPVPAADSVPSAAPFLRPGFLERRGQSSADTSFELDLGDARARFTDDGVQLTGAQGEMSITFPDSRPSTPAGIDRLPHSTNLAFGRDPTRWLGGLHTFRELVYRDLYPGADLVFKLDRGDLKYEFHLDPGADHSAPSLAYGATSSLQLLPGGDLLITSPLGEYTDPAPVSFQPRPDGSRLAVDCSYRLLSPLVIGFDCARVDRSLPLVIDPLVYSTYFSDGDRGEEALAVAVDSSGNAYVTGLNTSIYGLGIWVAKLNPSGSALVYLTYFGGNNDEGPYDIAIDAAGNAYITGWTYSTDFPTTSGAYDRTHNGDVDAFVTKLNAAGSAITYSTLLGDVYGDYTEGIAVDGAGSAYVVGGTNSPAFPTTPSAFDTSHNGGSDAFLTKLNPAGSALAYSTYFGGSTPQDCHDQLIAVAVDSSSRAHVAGITQCVDLPTTSGALSRALSGYSDGFVTRFSGDGASLGYSTYLGGLGYEWPLGIALGANDTPIVAGGTSSTDFPVTAGAGQQLAAGGEDGFVVRLDATASAPIFSTYIGSPSDDAALDVALGPGGDAYIGGRAGPDFPLTADAFDTGSDGYDEGFFAAINATGGFRHSTYIGGSGWESVNGIAVASGAAYLAGSTDSFDFPTTPGAYDRTNGTPADAFIAKYVIGGNSAPRVVQTSPYDGETGIRSTRVRVQFDQAMNSSTTIAALSVSPTLPNATAKLSGGTLDLAVTSFLPNTRYTVTVAPSAKGINGVAMGSTYSFNFTTGEPPNVRVITPNGGEKLRAQDLYLFYFSVSSGSYPLDYLRFYASLDGGANWTDIGSSPANVNFYEWLIPDTLTSDALLRVEAYDYGPAPNWAADDSDLTFSVVAAFPPIPTITRPNGGESLIQFTAEYVTWTWTQGSFPLRYDGVSIDYSTTGASGPWTNIVTGTVNDGSHTWFVPGVSTNDAFIRIEIQDDRPRPNLGIDRSEAGFAIAPFMGPQALLTSPNGGELLKVGDPVDITWTASSGSYPLALDPIAVHYSISGRSGPWKIIAGALPNTGRMSWQLPDDPTNDGCVKVEARDDRSPANVRADVCDTVFAIVRGTAPTVVRAEPASGSTGVRVDVNVSLRFSLRMDPAATEGAFTITPAVAGTFIWDAVGETLRLFPSSSLSYSTSYTVVLTTRARSAVGVPLAAEFRTTFTTGPVPIQPKVSGTTPTSGATGIALSAPVAVRFDVEMEPAATLAAFRITPAVAGTVAVVDRNLTWTHTAFFAPSTRYTVTIAATAKAKDGLELGVPFVFSFTTASSQPPAPRVLLTTPADRATDVAPDASVWIEFDTGMDPTTTAAAFGIFPRIDGEITVTGSTLRFGHKSPFELQTTYYIDLGTGALSAAGVPLPERFIFSFTTGDDPTPPQVISVSPADASVDVPIDSTIRLTFSVPMDRDATKAAVILTPGVRLIWEWDLAGKILVVTPREGLAIGTTYTIVVTTDARSEAAVPPKLTFTSWFSTVAPSIVPPPPPSTPASELGLGLGLGLGFGFAAGLVAGVILLLFLLRRRKPAERPEYFGALPGQGSQDRNVMPAQPATTPPSSGPWYPAVERTVPDRPSDAEPPTSSPPAPPPPSARSAAREAAGRRPTPPPPPSPPPSSAPGQPEARKDPGGQP